MKKFLIIAFSALISATLFSGVIAFAEGTPAADPAAKTPGTIEQKVYYSESLGIDGEKKIFQITSCAKIRAMAPLRCTAKGGDPKNGAEQFPEQCEEKNTHKARVGTIVRGCRKEQPSADKPYPKVDTTTLYDKAPKGCSDVSDQQAPYLVPLWALVKGKNASTLDKLDQWIYVDSIPFDSQKADDVRKAKDVQDYGAGIDVVPQYNATLCQPVDLDSEKLQPVTSAKDLGITGSLATGLFEKTSSSAGDIVDKDAGACKISAQHASPFDSESSVTCSVMYYVSGKNGIDIFSQYVKLLYTWAAGIVGIVAVFTIVYNGIAISMSAGGEITEAKNRIMQSIVGLVILFLSGLILYTINPTFFTS